MRRWVILIAFFGMIGICSATYIPPSYSSVNLTLSIPYTPPFYYSVNLTLGETNIKPTNPTINKRLYFYPDRNFYYNVLLGFYPERSFY